MLPMTRNSLKLVIVAGFGAYRLETKALAVICPEPAGQGFGEAS